MAIAGKILGKVLLKRLATIIIEPVLLESQCGFRANRGTTDMIFCELLNTNASVVTFNTLGKGVRRGSSAVVDVL